MADTGTRKITPGHLPESLGLKALVSEIALLVDFLTSRPNNSVRSNATLKLPMDCTTHASALQQYIETAERVRGGGDVTSHDLAFLLEMLDYMGSLTNPVGGDSVAFSVMVANHRRPGWRVRWWRRMTDHWTTSRTASQGVAGLNGVVRDARIAFPSYVRLARQAAQWHSMHRVCLWFLALVVAIISIDLQGMSSTIKVLGEYKRQTEAARTDIIAKDRILSEKSDKTGQDIHLHYCQHRNFMIYKPLDREKYYICTNWHDLANKRDNAYIAMDRAVRDSLTCSFLGWMVCRDVDRRPKPVGENGVPRIVGVLLLPDQYASEPVFSLPVRASVPHELMTDQAAATVVGKITFFLLAPSMSLLGALISVIRTHVNDVRERLMTPRTSKDAAARIVLGVSAGIVLSYFYAPGEEPAQRPEGIIEVAKLTIPALAFVVGASANFVFARIEGLAGDLFKRAPQ